MDPVYKESADGFRRCPYNPTHVVASVRFIGHLMKCSRSSGKKHQVCPWNAQHHIVEPSDYNQHVNTCVFRTLVDHSAPKYEFSASENNEEADVNDGFWVDEEENNLHEKNLREIIVSQKPAQNVSNEQYPPTQKTGIYGDLDEVEKGIAAIIDAFAASSFAKSANGLAILQHLVDTINEEAKKTSQ